MRLKLLLLLTIASITTSESDNDKKVFVPTNEWQLIGEGIRSNCFCEFGEEKLN